MAIRSFLPLNSGTASAQSNCLIRSASKLLQLTGTDKASLFAVASVLAADCSVSFTFPAFFLVSLTISSLTCNLVK
jgi:hypothetical protein